MKRSLARSAFGIATLAAFAGSAVAANGAGWYAGINAGQSLASIDDAKIAGGLLAGGFSAVSISDDDRDVGYKLYGGYQFNRYFALEGGFFDLGKFGFSAVTVPAGTLDGRIRLRGVNLDAVGILPLSDRFSAFGRVGVNHAEARDTFTGSGRVHVLDASPSKRDTNYKYGLGLQYALTPRLALRVEAERYRINDAVGNKGDVDLASIGLVYRFGDQAETPSRRVSVVEPVSPLVRAPVPEPVAAAPAPPVPAPAPRPTKVTFSADSLFDFDKSVVKPAGKQALEKFAEELRGVQYDVVTVTGHTDRIGSPNYNLALSARRAAAVKDYLATPAGIPADKITARGMGETAPVTRQDECKGEKADRRLIACLQPDRRVEVEVTGTK